MVRPDPLRRVQPLPYRRSHSLLPPLSLPRRRACEPAAAAVCLDCGGELGVRLGMVWLSWELALLQRRAGAEAAATAEPPAAAGCVAVG